MTTDELVRALGASLVPVERRPRVETRAVQLCATALGFVVVCLALLGLRADWQQRLHEASFLREQAALLGLFALSVWSTLELSVPGGRAALARTLPILATLVWLALVLGRVTDHDELGPSGVKCAARMVGLSLVPLAALFASLRGEPLLDARRIGTFGCWAAASLAMFGTQWLCTRDAPWHVLAWHCGPVLLAGFLGHRVGARLR